MMFSKESAFCLLGINDSLTCSSLFLTFFFIRVSGRSPPRVSMSLLLDPEQIKNPVLWKRLAFSGLHHSRSQYESLLHLVALVLFLNKALRKGSNAPSSQDFSGVISPILDIERTLLVCDEDHPGQNPPWELDKVSSIHQQAGQESLPRILRRMLNDTCLRQLTDCTPVWMVSCGYAFYLNRNNSSSLSLDFGKPQEIKMQMKFANKTKMRERGIKFLEQKSC